MGENKVVIGAVSSSYNKLHVKGIEANIHIYYTLKTIACNIYIEEKIHILYIYKYSKW